MPTPRSNLPVILAAAAAAVSVATLTGVLVWRARVATPAPPADHTADSGSSGGSEGSGEPSAPPGPTDSSGTGRSAASTEAVLKAANTLVQQGEADRAEAALRAAVAEQPDDQELRLALAGACVLQQKMAAAYQEYEAALAIGPRTADIEFTAGTVASQLRRFDRAEEHFAAAQATDPEDPRFPLYLAQVQIALGRGDEARKNLLLATRLDETLAIAWGTLAQLSLRDNEPNVALQLVARARDLEPSVSIWRIIEARASNRSGDPERAIAVLQGLPAAERQQIDVLRILGESFGLLGRPAEALREFEAAAVARPDDGPLLLETAVWGERSGDAEKALGYARRAEALGTEGAAKMAARLAGDG